MSNAPAPAVYVVAPTFSGIAGPFDSEADALEYAEAENGKTITREQIDPGHPVLKKRDLYDRPE